MNFFKMELILTIMEIICLLLMFFSPFVMESLGVLQNFMIAILGLILPFLLFLISRYIILNNFFDKYSTKKFKYPHNIDFLKNNLVSNGYRLVEHNIYIKVDSKETSQIINKVVFIENDSVKNKLIDKVYKEIANKNINECYRTVIVYLCSEDEHFCKEEILNFKVILEPTSFHNSSEIYGTGSFLITCAIDNEEIYFCSSPKFPVCLEYEKEKFLKLINGDK